MNLPVSDSSIKIAIVVQPQVAFSHIDKSLNQWRWMRQPDPTAPPPLISGEPDMAVWTRPEGDVRLTYTFHPAMYLRVLTVSGDGAEQVALELCDHIPILTINDIRQLLQDRDLESMLLGLHAANVLDAFELMGEVAKLTAHSDELVVQEAQSILQQLLQKGTSLGLELLAEWKIQHPDHSVLFRLAGGSIEKRQVLRWLIQERSASNPAIDAVLRTALNDADWEVQATAMLAVGRLRAVNLATAVRGLTLPDALTASIDKITHRILAACRKAVLAILEEAPTPPQSVAPPNTREAMNHHILRCILGESVQFQERAFLLIHALMTPLPDRWLLPEPLPEGIVKTATGYSLADYDLALCWVPPVPHWLGHDLPKMPLPNPIRLHHPARGFFISQRLFGPPGESSSSHPYRCSWMEAVGWCDRMATATQLNIHLPTPDQWEMALRGPDGRLLPWGNDLTPSFGLSPWGLEEFAIGPGEWTCETASTQEAITVGAAKPIPCALRRLSLPDQMALAFRLVVQI